MTQLISPAQAAKRMGVSLGMVYTWMRRAENPLPSVPVGKSGRNAKVVASQIDEWLAAEAERAAKK